MDTIGALRTRPRPSIGAASAVPLNMPNEATAEEAAKVATPRAAARRRRRRTARVVWPGTRSGMGVGTGRDVEVRALRIVGDLSSVGPLCRVRGRGTLFWLGGPHICAFTPQPVTGKGGPAWLLEPGVLAGVHVRVVKMVTCRHTP